MNAPTQTRTTSIDWIAIRSDYDAWRSTLWTETQTTLKAIAVSQASMVQLNTIGAYHKIRDGYQDTMKKEYKEIEGVPHKWVTKGNFPGIWCALFDQRNTYSFAWNPAIIKFTFKAEYQIYDPMNESHKTMWETWKSVNGNLEKPNRWAEDKNDDHVPMSARMKMFCRAPDHEAFYQEHRFGAIIGYSDYIALVVVQEKAIDKVEFLT